MSALQKEASRPEESKALRRKQLRPRGAILLGVMASLAVGGIWTVSRSRSVQDVFFVNGLDVPVDVEVDGSRFSVNQGGQTVRSLREGIHEVRVLGEDGSVIEEGPVDIPGRRDAVAYNVLGAAPLYKADIVYSSAGSNDNDNDNSEPSFLGGDRVTSVEHVDYLFVEPARSISVKNRQSGRVSRVLFHVGQGGWLSTTSYLHHEGDPMKAAAIARAVARAEPTDDQAMGYAVHYTDLAEGTVGSLRFLRAEKARAPNNFDTHGYYIGAMRRAGLGDEARVEYEALYKANPDSAFHGLLFTRVVSRQEARATYDALLSRYPNDRLVWQKAAGFMAGELDFGRAVELFEKLQDDPRYPRFLDDHARSLVGLGRVSEALALVSRFASKDAKRDIRVTALYARLTRLSVTPGLPAPAGADVGAIIGQKPDGDSAHLWVTSLLGDSVSASDLATIRDEDLRRTVEIQAAALRDPALARELCASASPIALERLDSTVAILLAAELARLGAPAVATRMLEARWEYAAPPSALLRYVTSGTEHPDLWRASPEVRAALDFVRTRKLAEEGRSTTAFDEAIARGDPLQGVVTLARAAWPKVETGAPDKGGAASKRDRFDGAKADAKTADKPPSALSPVVVLRKEPQTDRAP